MSASGRAVLVGLFGLQTIARRVTTVISRSIPGRSWRSSASSLTVIARAPEEAASWGYTENEGHA